jgi:hypothetical protein
MIRLTGIIDLPAIGRPVGTSPIREEDMPISNRDVTKDTDFNDHEGEMARASLMRMNKQTAELFNMIEENEELEGWVQQKISLAADYINSVYNSISYDRANVSTLGAGIGSPADAPLAITEKMENNHKSSYSTEGSTFAGWEGTIRAMKKDPNIDNPWALANWMKSQGYKPLKKR